MLCRRVMHAHRLVVWANAGSSPLRESLPALARIRQGFPLAHPPTDRPTCLPAHRPTYRPTDRPACVSGCCFQAPAQNCSQNLLEFTLSHTFPAGSVLWFGSGKATHPVTHRPADRPACLRAGRLTDRPTDRPACFPDCCFQAPAQA